MNTALRIFIKIYAMAILLRLLILISLSLSTEALANPLKNIGICKSATHQIEKKMNIPSNLLHAISLTESGRWIEEDKENIAWPWTVSSGGPGIYFNTKSEAINHVKKLQSKGVTNIDIGCMQINLFYHGNAFKDLNDAFDPVHNAQYAGEFLTRLFNDTKSWTQAAGRYHSSEPSKGMYYREKVIAFWNHSTKEEHDETQQIAEVERKDKGITIASIDTERTALLNNSFRKRLNIQESATNRAEKMNEQISEWRNSRSLSNYNALNAARQKALYQQKVKKTLMVPNTPQRGLTQTSFANRRSAQLEKWRRTVANPEIIALANQKRGDEGEITPPRTLLEQ